MSSFHWLFWRLQPFNKSFYLRMSPTKGRGSSIVAISFIFSTFTWSSTVFGNKVEVNYYSMIISISNIYDITLYETFLITLFHFTIQDGVRRAKRSTAEAPQAGKDEVISGCYNKNKLIP